MPWVVSNLRKASFTSANTINFVAQKSGKMFTLKRRREGLLGSLIAYSIFHKGKRVPPLAEEHLDKRKSLPNVVAEIKPEDKIVEVDVIDLGDVAGQGAGLPILNLLSSIAMENNLSIKLCMTNNIGVIRLFEKVTNYSFSQRIKSILYECVAEDIRKQNWGVHSKAGFRYTSTKLEEVQFYFDVMSQSYGLVGKFWDLTTYIGFWGNEDFWHLKDMIVDYISPEDSRIPIGADFKRFTFNPDGTFAFDGEHMGHMVSWGRDLDLIAKPQPIDYKVRVFNK